MTMDWDEPIPDFKSRFPNKLESCLIIPFQSFGKKILYKSLIVKPHKGINNLTPMEKLINFFYPKEL